MKNTIFTVEKNTKIRVFGGRLVDPFDPQPEDIQPEVFIHALSCINRYTGSAKYPYSVGQHTRNLVHLVPAHLRRAAMVHDFGEAWFNDIASPIKQAFPDYKKAEKKAAHYIANHFGVTDEELEEFDPWDKSIYINERDNLFINCDDGADMGADREGLDCSDCLFNETDWRIIRSKLLTQWNLLFKDNQILKPEWVYREPWL